MRNPKEFEIEREEIFECDPARLFVIFSDILQWPEDGQPRMLKVSEPNFVQVSFADATRVRVSLERHEVPGKSVVTIEHELISDLEQQSHWNEYWDEQVAALRARVEL